MQNEEKGIVKEGIILQNNVYATDIDHINRNEPQYDMELLAGIDLSGIGRKQVANNASQQNVTYVDQNMVYDNRRGGINSPRRIDNTVIDGILTSNKQMMNASTNFDLNLDNRDDIDNRDDDFYDDFT